jgi:hypothetical protein
MKRCAGYAEQELAPSNIVSPQTSRVNHLNLFETHYEPKLHALFLNLVKPWSYVTNSFKHLDPESITRFLWVMMPISV